jgi:septal ring factor EnvC (AmiA/AmiB activator)
MEITKEYLDKQIASLNRRLDKLPTQGDFADLKEDVERVNSQVRSIKTDVLEMKQTVDKLNARDLQDSDAFAKILNQYGNRINRLEKQLKLRPN